MTAERLRDELAEAVFPPSVEELAEGLLAVLLPDPSAAHRTIQLTAKHVGDKRWLISDLGEARNSIGGGDIQQIAEWLNCSGGEVEAREGELTVEVDEPELAPKILDLYRQVLAAPSVWEAERCIAGRDVEREPSAVQRMAEEHRAKVVHKLGRHLEPAVKVSHRFRAMGEQVTAPFAVVPVREPGLIATFLDETAGSSSRAHALRGASWLLTVTREMRVPRFIIVRGTAENVEHYAEIYDAREVTVLPEGEDEPFLFSIRDAVGFNS